MPLGRIEIRDVRPRTPTGHPPKGSIGERVVVSADILRDGHIHLGGRIRWRAPGQRTWRPAPLAEVVNDRWEGSFEPTEVGLHELVLEAWTDRFGTWRDHAAKRAAVDEPDLDVELLVGAELLEGLAPDAPKEHRERLLDTAATLRSSTCSLRTKLDAGLDDHLADLVSAIADEHDLTRFKTPGVWVDRERGRFSAWYELFPRSEGGFSGATKRLAAIAEMGFDIVYLPPIHPIGRTYRKGKGNTLTPSPSDPGSPWAIGAAEGGHDAIAPELGTLADFVAFREEVEALGMEVALDYALQCSPDHPWVQRAPRVVPAATRRVDPVRREPAEEVPGHPPDRVLARGGSRSRRALDGVPRHPRALDRPRRQGLPRRQPAHEAVRLLGVGDRRHPLAATPR